MQFSIRLNNLQGNSLLSIRFRRFLGKKISKDDLNLHISKNYYGEQLVDLNEAKTLLKNSSVINMVGKEIISLSTSMGIGSESGIKEIDGVPFLIVFKM